MNYLLVMPKELATGASTTAKIFPLGIAYVSTSLKQAGYNVFTTNLDFHEGDTYSILKKLMTVNHIDVLCTSGLSLDWLKILEVIKAARKINPEIIIVVGGGIMSSDPQTVMRVLDADIGVISEGEITICELAHALDNRLTYNNVHGLIYKDSNNTFVTTPPRKEIADIDSIPFPDFDGFNYGSWVHTSGMGGGMLISDRSCPFRCTFCFHPTGVKYRQRSLDNIFMEIDYQIQHYHLKSIGLSSELFATNKQRLVEFCNRIKKYNIAWTCCLRVSDVDAELLQLMNETGNHYGCFGLESADNSVLKSMRKGITVEQIERALSLCYDANMSTENCNFIFGDINETKETIENTLKFWYRYIKKCHINLSLIQAYPGTYLYEYACNNGIITDKEQFLRDGCPVVNVSKLSNAEFHNLKSLIAELKYHPHVPAESLQIIEVHQNGDCKIGYTCRKCGTKSTTSACFYFTVTCCCPSCGTKSEVDTFECALPLQEAFFAHLSTDKEVALWGAGGIYYKLIHKYSLLSTERFLLVDANKSVHGLRICKKEIYAPDIILNKKIKTVIITALNHKAEIYNTLRSEYPSIEHIIIPSFYITKDGIVPVLKAL